MPIREQGYQVWAGEGPDVGLLGAGMSCVGAGGAESGECPSLLPCH